jgi:hypothetical protein
LLACACAWLGAAPASAAPVLLEDGVGFVTVDPATQDGIGAWTVNGVQHVRQQWFWIQRDASEASLDTIGSTAAASDATGDGIDDTVDVAFEDDTSLRVAIASTPIGDPASGLLSALTTELTLRATQGALVLRLFQYIDVDLFGSYADDDAIFSGGTAFVTEASGLGAWESSWDRAPDAVEIAVYDATLASLNDGAQTVLSGATAASGDVTIAAMWEISLPIGETFTLRQTQTIRVVPEPGVATLVALGLAGLAVRRKETAR